MKRLYSSHDPMTMGFLKAMLENSGFPCMMRNEFLAGAAGDLPVNECWQELWILRESDFDDAKELVDSSLVSDPSHRDWSCPVCGEAVDAQFGSCWNCGTVAP